MGIVGLQERDVLILRFVAKFAYCQERQIATLCKTTARNANKVILRLVKSGYLSRQKVLASEDAYIFLGKNGAILLDVTQTKKLVLNTLEHDTLLVDLYFSICSMCEATYANADYSLQTDKELRRELGLGDEIRIPDLLLNDTIAIELEISEKSRDRLQDIVNSYIIHDTIQEVRYYLYSTRLAQKIYALTNANSKFKFFILTRDAAYNLSITELVKNGNLVEDESQNCKLSNGINRPPKTFGNFTF